MTVTIKLTPARMRKRQREAVAELLAFLKANDDGFGRTLLEVFAPEPNVQQPWNTKPHLIWLAQQDGMLPSEIEATCLSGCQSFLYRYVAGRRAGQ